MPSDDPPDPARLVVNRLVDLADAVQHELRQRKQRERERELLALPAPRRMGLRPLLAVPGVAARFSRQVPTEHLTRVDRGFDVACPCGQEHHVGDEQLMAFECQRAFISDGRIVYVSSPPTKPDETSRRR